MNEYKKRLLALTFEDTPMLVHAWWEAMDFAQGQPLSVSLAIAEKAINDLLAQGFIRLYRLTSGDMTHPEWSEIPEPEFPELLRTYFAWVPYNEPHPYFRITEAGNEELDRLRRLA